MVNLKNIWLLVLIVILAAGCSMSIINQDKLFIKKGLTTAEFKNIFNEHSNESLLKIDSKYVLDLDLNQDNSNKYTVMLRESDKNWFFLFRMFEPSRFNYIYAFKNDSLLFWGNPAEFARHQSPIINEIGKKTLKKFEEYFYD